MQKINSESKLPSYKNILISIIGNIIILSLTLFITEMRYESNDDYYLSIMCGNDGYFNFLFINYYLAKFIHIVQSYVGLFNVFVFLQILTSFISFVVIAYVFLEKNSKSFLKYLGFIFVIIFAYDHYCLIQFTKTSALVLTAGAILLMEYLLKAKKIGYYLIGMVLTILGSLLRFENIYVALAFSVIFLFAYTIVNKKNMSFFTNKAFIIKSILIILIIFGSLGIQALSMQQNASTNELQDYLDYNEQRYTFIDYPEPDYKSNTDLFSALDITENDYNLMSNWFLDSDSTATIQNLKMINKLKDNKEFFDGREITTDFLKTIKDDVFEMNFRGFHVVLLLIVTIAGLFFLKLRWAYYPVFIGVLAIILYFYLIYVGRPIYRATYIIDLLSMVWLLYSIDVSYYRSNLSINKFFKIFVVTITIITIILIFLSANAVNNYYAQYKSTKCNSNELFKYIQEHKENYFVFDVSTSTTYIENLNYYHNPLAPLPSAINSNVGSFGGWTSESPYENKKMNKYSISNVYNDPIDKDNIIIVQNNKKFKNRCEKHLNEHYSNGERIEYVLYKEVGGFKLWKLQT